MQLPKNCNPHTGVDAAAVVVPTVVDAALRETLHMDAEGALVALAATDFQELLSVV